MNDVNNNIESFKRAYSDEYFDSLMTYEKIILIGKENNGYITSKDVTKNNISRQYIKLLENKGAIEKVDRGIYVLKGVAPDDFFVFQLRYPKTIFSHFSALYLYNLTEEFPYKFDITCSNSYNVKGIKDNNVFYVNKDVLDLGKIEIKTKYKNKVNVYDIERTICDIIRCDNRMDEEQLIKTLKSVFSSKIVNMHKLSQYSKKLNCHDKVMKIVRYYDE